MVGGGGGWGRRGHVGAYRGARGRGDAAGCSPRGHGRRRPAAGEQAGAGAGRGPPVAVLVDGRHEAAEDAGHLAARGHVRARAVHLRLQRGRCARAGPEVGRGASAPRGCAERGAAGLSRGREGRSRPGRAGGAAEAAAKARAAGQRRALAAHARVLAAPAATWKKLTSSFLAATALPKGRNGRSINGHARRPWEERTRAPRSADVRPRWQGGAREPRARTLQAGPPLQGRRRPPRRRAARHAARPPDRAPAPGPEQRAHPRPGGEEATEAVQVGRGVVPAQDHLAFG